MATDDAPPVFTDRDVRLIDKSLPDAVDPRRRKLLGQVLREWSRNDLREHLSRESSAIIRERAKRVKMVGRRARSLLRAIDALDDRDKGAIAVQMPRAGVPLWPKMSGHLKRETSEILGMIQRIRDEHAFLAKLASAAPAAWKRGPGQPRNITAYDVMRDAAAIFEWLTNLKAARVVDRVSGDEVGPFWRFLGAVWPVVFGKGDEGLRAAMKNWARLRSLHHEQSALLANLALKHPTWGIFER
jgi:hypothetical protein